MTIVKISPHCLLNPSHSLLFVIPEAVWRVGREWHHSLPPRYLKIHKLYEFGTYIRHTSWQKMTIDDVNILLRDLGTFYRPETKLGTDSLSEVLLVLYWSQTLSDMLGRWKNYTHDTIMAVTWLEYNLQTRWKMRTRFCISSSACSIDFNFVTYVGVT